MSENQEDKFDCIMEKKLNEGIEKLKGYIKKLEEALPSQKTEQEIENTKLLIDIMRRDIKIYQNELGTMSLSRINNALKRKFPAIFHLGE